MPEPEFRYQRLLQFYETDAMGIIHHANYFLFAEEARLQFLRRFFESQEGDILADINYPLVNASMEYKWPLRFNETLSIDYKVITSGMRLIFEYKLWTKSVDKPCAFGKTEHVAFDMKKQKAIRLPETLVEFLEKQGLTNGS